MGKDANQMKLFKCHDCGQQFYVTGDELEDVVCRNCQSDNVTPVNNTTMWLKILTFVAIAVVGCGTALFFMKGEKEVRDVPDSIEELKEILKIAQISHSDFTDHGNNTYSFVAKCEFEGKEKTNYKYEYVLMDNNGKVLKTSTDGKFSNLGGTESGSYFYNVVISNKDAKVETPTMEVIGFEKVPVLSGKSPDNKIEEVSTPKLQILANPWTKEELEEKILDSQASIDKNRHFISRSVKITYTNIRENEGEGPTNLTDIEGRLEFGLWESVKVTNISYNKQNVIIAFELEVEYPKD